MLYWTLHFCWELVKSWVKVYCLPMSKSNSYTLTSWELHILLPMRLRTMPNLPLLWVQMLTVCRKCWPYLSPLECLCPEECSATEDRSYQHYLNQYPSLAVYNNPVFLVYLYVIILPPWLSCMQMYRINVLRSQSAAPSSSKSQDHVITAFLYMYLFFLCSLAATH